MQITFLGTGTSTGVPAIGCDCQVCRSEDPRDSRRRTSALVSIGRQRLLLDCGPDFRQQMLDEGGPWPDAVLITHSHADHIGGLEDLRPLPADHSPMPVYCRHDVASDLRRRLYYCFTDNPYPGIPEFNLIEIKEFTPFHVGETEVMPLAVMHGKLPILGYRIGPLAYITDCSTLPEQTLEMLHGVDTLVINALRFKEHHSHMNLQQALDVINIVKPRRSYLIHMSHSIGLHRLTSLTLPEGVHLAYDGLTVEI